MGTKRVLLVEDEANIRDTLKFNLTREGYTVSEARTATEALRLFRAGKPDIVLLDIMLPEMNGLEVCRIIRQESAVPVIMLTAKDQEVDKVVGLGVGADDYITKPFGLRELFARMTAVLRRAESQGAGPTAPPDTEQLGGLTIDRAARRVLLDGEEVRLTAKEFDLLSYFLAQPGRVHSRSHLLQHVWRYNYVGDAKTVDVHVRWLRQKFAGRAPFEIVTVRGVGYRADRLDQPGNGGAQQTLSA
jgi:two-component system alkaline phosphatase synthesis response regulator PhoP